MSVEIFKRNLPGWKRAGIDNSSPAAVVDGQGLIRLNSAAARRVYEKGVGSVDLGFDHETGRFEIRVGEGYRFGHRPSRGRISARAFTKWAGIRGKGWIPLVAGDGNPPELLYWGEFK